MNDLATGGAGGASSACAGLLATASAISAAPIGKKTGGSGPSTENKRRIYFTCY